MISWPSVFLSGVCIFSFLPAGDVHIENFAAGQECERLCFRWAVTEDEGGWAGFVDTGSGSSIGSRVASARLGSGRFLLQVAVRARTKENGGVLSSKRSCIVSLLPGGSVSDCDVFVVGHTKQKPFPLSVQTILVNDTIKTNKTRCGAGCFFFFLLLQNHF